MILLFQSVSDVKEIITIESVSAIGLLLFFMVYLIWQNHLLKKDLVAKDFKIDGIVKEHQQDLKEGTKDAVTMLSKYNNFVQQLSSLNTHRHER